MLLNLVNFNIPLDTDSKFENIFHHPPPNVWFKHNLIFHFKHFLQLITKHERGKICSMWNKRCKFCSQSETDKLCCSNIIPCSIYNT